MAHGQNRINICFDCNQYILVSRFHSDPVCPNCKKISTQTTENEIRCVYSIFLLDALNLHFNNWTKIKYGKRNN